MPFKLWGTLSCQPVFSHPVAHLHHKLQGQPHGSTPPPLNKAYLCVTVICSLHQVAHVSPPSLTCSQDLNVQPSSPRTIPQQLCPQQAGAPPPGPACVWKYIYLSGYTRKFQGLPWGSRGKESTLQCRGHWFKLRCGKIPHVTGQLSPCATTTDPGL